MTIHMYTVSCSLPLTRIMRMCSMWQLHTLACTCVYIFCIQAHMCIYIVCTYIYIYMNIHTYIVSCSFPLTRIIHCVLYANCRCWRVHVYISAYMYIYSVFKYICVHIYSVYIYVYMNIHMYIVSCSFLLTRIMCMRSMWHLQMLARTCVCKCIYVFVYCCIQYTYTYVYIYTSVCTYMNIHSIHICICILYTSTYVYIYTSVCTYMDIHMYTDSCSILLMGWLRLVGSIKS